MCGMQLTGSNDVSTQKKKSNGWCNHDHECVFGVRSGFLSILYYSYTLQGVLRHSRIYRNTHMFTYTPSSAVELMWFCVTFCMTLIGWLLRLMVL